MFTAFASFMYLPPGAIDPNSPSVKHLTCLGMNTFPLWQNLQQGRLASYSGPSDFSRPYTFSPSTRPKLAPVSNTAFIYGEESLNILLLPWIQFKNEPSD